MNTRFKFALVTVLAIAAVGVTVALGLWQLSRATEKREHQAAVERQSAKSPLDSAAVRQAGDPLSLLYQRARLRGSWAQGATVYLENRPMDGRVGFLVLTPLLLEGGGALVVQRGWTPRNFVDRTRLTPLDTPRGVVEVEGRMALPPSDLYAPGGVGDGAIRQNLDLTQFRGETGLPLLAVTLQQTGASGDGLRRDWPAANLGVEKNLGYALQWFALAGLIAVLYVWFQIVRRFIHRPKDLSRHV
ncbi:MAG: SURF1 family protein [Rhodoferax sp.]